MSNLKDGGVKDSRRDAETQRNWLEQIGLRGSYPRHEWLGQAQVQFYYLTSVL